MATLSPNSQKYKWVRDFLEGFEAGKTSGTQKYQLIRDQAQEDMNWRGGMMNNRPMSPRAMMMGRPMSPRAMMSARPMSPRALSPRAVNF